jgi:hypothetical protein
VVVESVLIQDFVDLIIYSGLPLGGNTHSDKLKERAFKFFAPDDGAKARASWLHHHFPKG